MKTLLRKIRHNRSLGLLLAALVVAVTALTSVDFFVDRVDRGLKLQGAALMAADLVIQTGEPLPDSWSKQAQSNGLLFSRQASFPSVLFYNDEPILVQIKAVDNAYPLRGRLTLENLDGGLTEQIPAQGNVFVDPVLKAQIVNTPDNSQPVMLPLGELQMVLKGSVNEEPDRGGSLFQLAPRVLINYQDLPDTGLLGPASRVRYRFLVAGAEQQIAVFREWASLNMPSGGNIIDIENARPELRTALERGQRFLSLASLCASLLAGIAILLAARRYVNLAIDSVAIMRTIGMTSAQVLNRHLIELFQVLLIGTFIGILLGFAGQFVLADLVGRWFGETLPAPGWRPVLLGLLYALVLLPGFSLPVLLRIRSVSPLRVLRRELDPPDASAVLVWISAIGSFAALVFWQVQDYRLAIAIILSLLAVMLIAVGVGSLLIVILRLYRRSHTALGLGLASLARHAALTRWQLAGFSMGIMLLLILGVVRIDLVDTWTTSLSPTAPNHFLINIQPDEQQGLQQWFESENVINSGMYASSRGRLVAIDGVKVDPDSFATDRGKRLAGREFSLGFSDRLQSDNRIIKGTQQWPPAGKGFTVEEGLAESLNLDIGSELSFDLAGQRLTAPIISIRTISWDSFNVNFFVQGSESLMQGFPVAYLNSLYLDENSAAVLKKIAADYPAVSVLDLRPLLSQVRDIMDKGSLAVEAVFLLTLLSAVLVTLGAVLISREERAREIAVLRTLGADRKRVIRSVLTEFGLIGLISGLVAATLSALTGYLVAIQLFGLTPVFNPLLWLGGVGSGVAVLLAVGYFSTRSLINSPPIAVINSGS